MPSLGYIGSIVVFHSVSYLPHPHLVRRTALYIVALETMKSCGWLLLRGHDEARRYSARLRVYIGTIADAATPQLLPVVKPLPLELIAAGPASTATAAHAQPQPVRRAR